MGPILDLLALFIVLTIVEFNTAVNKETDVSTIQSSQWWNVTTCIDLSTVHISVFYPFLANNFTHILYLTLHLSDCFGHFSDSILVESSLNLMPPSYLDMC